MKTTWFTIILGSLWLAIAARIPAQEPKKEEAVVSSGAPASSGKVQLSQEELEAKFKSTLTQATMSGRWCLIKDGSLTPEKEEKYTILDVTKVGGDTWLIRARIQYGNRDVVAPIPAQVKWAGDTAVICVTDLPIPGGSVYTARVLIYGDAYAGTWSGGTRGGLLNGIIVRGQK